MTKRQYEICKNVIKYQKLPVILEKTNIKDYEDLQYDVGLGRLDFSNHEMDDSTIITLGTSLQEEYEQMKEAHYDARFTRITAILALIISIIALLKP